MPGVQINQLPVITTLTGVEAFVVQQPGVNGPTEQISALNVQQALSPVVASSRITAQLAAGLNSNINPAGLANASILKLTSVGGAAFSVDGIAAPAASKFLFVVNANAALVGALTLVDASASVSAAADRILTQAGVGLTLEYNGGVMLWYDPDVNNWRIVS